jgi:hypothetical protein
MTRFALALLLCGCGFTDKDKARPPDLGPTRDQGVVDVAVDAPVDGPVDVPVECPAAPADAPGAWICDASYYGDGSCDCGCGAPDPDCACSGCTGVGCCDPATCASLGCAYCAIVPDGGSTVDGGPPSQQCL